MGDCNYLYGNYSAQKRVKFLQGLLEFSGIEPQRLRTGWVSSAEAAEFAGVVRDFVQELKQMGPSPLNKQPASAGQEMAAA